MVKLTFSSSFSAAKIFSVGPQLRYLNFIEQIAHCHPQRTINYAGKYSCALTVPSTSGLSPGDLVVERRLFRECSCWQNDTLQVPLSTNVPSIYLALMKDSKGSTKILKREDVLWYDLACCQFHIKYA